MHHQLVAAPNNDPKLAPQLVAKLAVHEQPLQRHHGQQVAIVHLDHPV